MGIAFFDMDGTITRDDTYLAFIRFVRGRNAFYAGLLTLLPFILLYLFRLYPGYKLKERFFGRYLKRFSEAELCALGDQYGALALPAQVRRTALDRIAWHRLRGDRIVVLTASSPIWLAGWCRQYEVELKGTDFEVANGRFTGKIAGLNCSGAEKKRIVQELLSARLYTESFGYANARSDGAFLALVDHPHYRHFTG